MLKKLSQILLVIIFLIILFCVYLSVYGINTDKLNGIINEKISQRDSDFDIQLNKIKIFLDIGSIKLEAKTKNPIVFYKKKQNRVTKYKHCFTFLIYFYSRSKNRKFEIYYKKK